MHTRNFWFLNYFKEWRLIWYMAHKSLLSYWQNCYITVTPLLIQLLSINSSVVQNDREKTPKYPNVTEQQFSISLPVNKVNIKFPITERLQDAVTWNIEAAYHVPDLFFNIQCKKKKKKSVKNAEYFQLHWLTWDEKIMISFIFVCKKKRHIL